MAKTDSATTTDSVQHNEYIKITPSTSDLAPATVVRQIAGLHSLGGDGAGLLDLLDPFSETQAPPVFEFLALTEGEGEPIEFYYGADYRLDGLEERLRSLYPPTVTVERVTLDLEEKLLPDQDPSDLNERVMPNESGDRFDQTGVDAPFNVEEPSSTGDQSRSDGGQLVADTAQAEGNDEDSQLTREEVKPLGVTWYGSETRREDWMTTLAQFDDIEREDSQHARAPVASLLDQLARAEHPLVFQVLFQRKADWTHEAQERRRKLRDGEDTWFDILLSELFVEPEHSRQPSDTGRQDRYLDIGGRERAESIDDADPRHSFTTNMRALAFATETSRPDLDRRLDNIAAVFDHLDGGYYRVKPKRVRRGLRKGRRAKKHVKRVLDRKMAVKSDWWKTRPDLVLDPGELANFIVVPPESELTTEGGRGSDATPETQSSRSLPSQTQMQALTDSGMAIGYGLDENDTPTDEPIRVPPDLLNLHLARIGSSGSGKSTSESTDTLSLHEETSGPEIVISPKGASFAENYMRAHAHRFGVEDLEENVLYFSVPEILPGFAFFDIRPDLDAGVRRADAVQDKANHFEEIIKLAMGADSYEDAIASPNILKYLIKAMYDEEYGLENGPFRKDINYFSHAQLEHALGDFHAAGPPDPSPEEAPRSSVPEIQRKFEQHLHGDSTSFSKVVGGVNNRLDYVTGNKHLRQIFNNTEPRFDFRELLDEDKVIIFDLGELRDEPSRVMTGLILTQLYDAVNDRSQRERLDLPDDYVANLLIDEASSVVVSETLNTMLEKGREFELGIELLMQFTEQMREEGNNQVHLNVLNNVATKLVSNVPIDPKLARALAYEDMDPEDVEKRLRALPRGQWLANVPDPTFGDAGPLPFNLAPLSIPPGHPESDQPLTDAQEERFQKALETVKQRTQAEYGVPEDIDVPDPAAAEDVEREYGEDVPLDVALARAIRAVQIAEDCRDSNGWVPVDTVDEELLSRLEDDALEDRKYDSLWQAREFSSLIEVQLGDDGDTVVCRLTDEGEVASQPDTSSSPTGGGDEHDSALDITEQALATRGFSVTVVDQDSTDQPDAIATHPDLDTELQVEVETTTHTRPAKVLTNLQKAQEAGRIPLFVVDQHEDTPAREIAARLDNILREPRNELSSGETRLYTTNQNIMFEGGANAANGKTALRPADDGSRQTRWLKQDNSLVLEDGNGTKHAHLAKLDNATAGQFPATYSYDEEEETYTVSEPGYPDRTYDSWAALTEEWVPVKRPFVPETDLPVPGYDASSYAIAIITEQDGESTVQLYDPTDNTTSELSGLVTDISRGSLHPAGVDSSVTAESEESDVATDDTTAEGETEVLQMFADEFITEREGNKVPVGDVFEVFTQFVAARGYEQHYEYPNTFSQDLQALTGHTSDRRWLSEREKMARCLIGVDLRDEALETLPDAGDEDTNERGEGKE